MSRLKQSHKSIGAYYEALQRYSDQDVDHEGAVRSAFQNLLDETGRKQDWTLIPELVHQTKNGTVYPDGTFRDDYYRPRGFWEAKDSRDDLIAEIRKKIARGYPLANTIFEDTRQAVLYQNGEQVFRAELADRQQLCDLLNAFFAYTEPAHEDFDKAIDEFKERVPHLARGLVDKIEHAHQHNRAFIEAFENYFELCKVSLNPNLRREAVDEMLVQHLLTERLIRTIFDQPDFVRRNVIAAEVERVIDALTSQTFSRRDFLKSLDRFYVAIESAAATIESFAEKQHFLNTVYERFFQGYSVKVADTHGIVYTPQEIVDFMCASVVDVLEREFGKRLGDPDVFVLDPCTGTGNFIVNLLRRVKKKDLPKFYRHQLFANEVMLLPYYIASLNIEHAYYEQAGRYEPFEGICFVDTLDLAEERQIRMFTEANTARVERQKKAPITIIIGNPPYNVGQQDENDQNRNRAYPVVDRRVKDTYVNTGTSTLRMQVYDPYVKFIRWSTDRLRDRPGIVCMVTNNGFLEGSSFDGFRKCVQKDFHVIYHFDLKGNARTAGERRRREGGNVFSDAIRAGIGISVFVRQELDATSPILLHRVDNYMKANEKKQYLASFNAASDVPWDEVPKRTDGTWVIAENQQEYRTLVPLGTRGDTNGIFERHSSGVKTNSDCYVFDFSRDRLTSRATDMVEAFNIEVDRWKRHQFPDDVDSFLRIDEHTLKWIRNTKRTLRRGKHLHFTLTHIRRAMYRAFDCRYYFFHRAFSEDTYRFPLIFPSADAERENQLICVPGPGNRKGFAAFVTNQIVSLDFAFEKVQCFPSYVYDEDGTNRRENITDWSLKQFRSHYKNKRIGKWDIFHYVYGVLHHPGYRERYADNLKRELPRIPFAPDFKAFRDAGRKLAELHLGYEGLDPWKLDWIETPGVPLSYRVEKMRLSKDKTSLKVNDSLTLAGIPPQVFDYGLGNRSALEWVIDQYRVKTDKRSAIISDPNNPDDPEYIVRLVRQVVRVSILTVEIVNALADLPFRTD